MPPQRRHRTPTSVSLITLYPFLFMTLSAAAQDNPTTTPPTVQPEVMIVPAQTPTSDLPQQHAAELEAQLIQRTQELDALQEQLCTAMEQLTSFRQQEHVLEALSGQLQTLEQRLTTLERDLVLAREAEASARGLGTVFRTRGCGLR